MEAVQSPIQSLLKAMDRLINFAGLRIRPIVNSGCTIEESVKNDSNNEAVNLSSTHISQRLNLALTCLIHIAKCWYSASRVVFPRSPGSLRQIEEIVWGPDNWSFEKRSIICSQIMGQFFGSLRGTPGMWLLSTLASQVDILFCYCVSVLGVGRRGFFELSPPNDLSIPVLVQDLPLGKGCVCVCVCINGQVPLCSVKNKSWPMHTLLYWAAAYKR